MQSLEEDLVVVEATLFAGDRVLLVVVELAAEGFAEVEAEGQVFLDCGFGLVA
jgi:hypothetical protein